jgi:hypothetical protein
MSPGRESREVPSQEGSPPQHGRPYNLTPEAAAAYRAAAEPSAPPPKPPAQSEYDKSDPERCRPGNSDPNDGNIGERLRVPINTKLFGSPTSAPESITEETGRPSGVAEKSLKESLKETVEVASRKTLELVGNSAHPGLGTLVNLAFIIHDLLQGLVALESPGAPRTLGVPIGDFGGIGISLQVAVPGKDSANESSPTVIAVVAPDDGSPLGGWDLEGYSQDHQL